ncbi:MAG: amidinotransferase [Bacteriovoracaceae bacterium]|nr:amidinotransferase [Bacteriovoracaceae bacterium]
MHISNLRILPFLFAIIFDVSASTPHQECIGPLSHLSSYDEWSPLREVVVGRVEGATVADEPFVMIQATIPENQWEFFRRNAGQPFPQVQIDAAARELNEFVRILEAEGVTVRRPDHPGDLFRQAIETAEWKTKGGLYVAMPRDNLLAIGNKIIEAPMAWRSRYHEGIPYQNLLQEYEKHRGVELIKSPRPKLADTNYVRGWKYSEDSEFRSVTNDDEPTFDAADFMRFGRDLVVQESHVTNAKGIRWLQDYLGKNFRIHTIQFNDNHPMHIDATIVPLRPGLVIINPERVPESLVRKLQSGLFKGWDFVKVPRPIIPDSHTLYMTSKWINMNVLSLDEKRVMVEAQDEPMIKLFKDLGMEPIKCPFRNFNTFGGSFHCATLDVHRDGKLEQHLDAP